MPLLYDHVPFTRAPGAYEFGPKNVPDKANSTLAASIARGGTSLTVQSGALASFPSPPFRVTLEQGGRAEIVRVTGLSGEAFTIEPAVGAWSVGAKVQVLTVITLRFGRCTTATPALWPSTAVEIAAQLYVTVDGGPIQVSGGIGYVAPDALALFQGGTTVAQLIAAGKLVFGAKGGVWIGFRGGIEAQENVLRCPVNPGLNRVVTGVLGVRGGTLDTELTLEVL